MLWFIYNKLLGILLKLKPIILKKERLQDKFWKDFPLRILYYSIKVIVGLLIMNFRYLTVG